MNKFGTLLLVGALALGGCGSRTEGDATGGGQQQFNANGEPVGLGAAVGQTYDVRVQSTPRRLDTGDVSVVEVRALVVDLDNNTVSGQPVAFSSSAGVLQNVSVDTDETGAAVATLALLEDARNQDVTVTVTAGTFSGETVVRVDGTAILVSGPTKVTAGAGAELGVLLASGTGDPIRGETIALEVSDGTLDLPVQLVSGSDGRATLSVPAVAGDAEITLTALEGTVVATHALETLAPGEEPGLGAATGETLDVRVQSDPPRLITGEGTTADITAFVVDLDNKAIANQEVSFSASAGVLQNVTGQTGLEGVASATLNLLGDDRTQDIVVRVVADGYEGQTVIRADGSGFAIEGPGKVIAGAQAELVVSLTDGAGAPVANERVSISSSVGNVVNPADGVTDADGTVTVRVGSTAGTDTIRLSTLDGTVTGTHALAVLTDSLAFEGIEADERLLVGQDHELTVTWTRQGQPVVNGALAFSTTTGRVIGESTVTTDTAGRARVSLKSDVPGAATVTVADATDGEPSESFDIEFVPALDVRVLSDVNRIETGGSDVANITALVTDVDNKSVPDQAVRFSATGGVLQGVSTTTDENGVAIATLKLLQDFRTQDIVVTVSADEFDGEVTVSADGSELEATGPASLVEGADAELVVVLSAGNGEPISNERVTFESVEGNTVSPAIGITDPDGRVDVRVEITTGAAEDTIRMLALDDTVVTSHSFTISTDSLVFDTLESGSEIPVGFARTDESNAVAVTWTSQGVPVVARALRFSTTAGRVTDAAGDDVSTVTTDGAGRATVYVSSRSAGNARVTVSDDADGEPSTHVDVEFIATTPVAVAIDASSSRVPAQGTSTVTALVTDADGNPVKGREVVFNSGDLKGGRLSPSSATSGSDGEASVTFTAGLDATELDEIELVATVEGTTIRDAMRLTVVERVINVTIGTSNEVVIDSFGTQYAMPFVVQVADGGGTPLENAEVTMSIRPIDHGFYGNQGLSNSAGGFGGAAYGKGRMALVDTQGFEQYEGGSDWQADSWAMGDLSIGCISEDANLNRILDVGEDDNGNGSLDPQDPASLAAVRETGFATLVGGSLTTDSTGSGYFRMIYPASNSLWANVEITARAQALGAEAEDSFRTTLLLPASEANDKESLPANYNSPYGIVTGYVDSDGNFVTDAHGACRSDQ